MKKCFFGVFVILSLLSCKEKEVELCGPPMKVKVMFIPIDAYKPVCSYFRNQVEIGLSSCLVQQEYWDQAFLQQYQFSSKNIIQKEDQLAEAFIVNGYAYEFGESANLIPIMYGGISGPVRVYSDKTVSGREAGENLSDLFIVSSYGRIRYPDMELIDDASHGEERRIYCLSQPFQEYFSLGTVLGFCSPNVYIHYPEGVDQSTTLFFEIPVTGVTSSGEEKTVVFTCECPGE